MADNKIYFRNMFSRCFGGAAKTVFSDFDFVQKLKFDKNSLIKISEFWKHSGNIQ
jgi:hypothetical protein